MWSLRLVTAPASEPVTLTEAKSQVRLEQSFIDDDDLLLGQIKAAREAAESLLARSLITQTWRYTLDRFPPLTRSNPLGYLYLPLGRAQVLLKFEYLDQAGAAAQPVPTTVYAEDFEAEPSRLILRPGQSWPSDASLWPSGAVTVEFVTGFGAAPENVPQVINQAILMTVGHFYENRESIVVSDRASVGVAEIPQSAKALLLGSPHVFSPIWPETETYAVGTATASS